MARKTWLFKIWQLHWQRKYDDGPYVHLGFRPAWVMVKCTSNSEHWNIADNKNGDRANGTVKFISSNLTTAERNMDDNPGIDFLSNGFKVRTSDGNMSISSIQLVEISFTWPLQNNQCNTVWIHCQMHARQIYNTCYNVSNRK